MRASKAGEGDAGAAARSWWDGVMQDMPGSVLVSADVALCAPSTYVCHDGAINRLPMAVAALCARMMSKICSVCQVDHCVVVLCTVSGVAGIDSSEVGKATAGCSTAQQELSCAAVDTVAA